MKFADVLDVLPDFLYTSVPLWAPPPVKLCSSKCTLSRCSALDGPELVGTCTSDIEASMVSEILLLVLFKSATVPSGLGNVGPNLYLHLQQEPNVLMFHDSKTWASSFQGQTALNPFCAFPAYYWKRGANLDCALFPRIVAGCWLTPFLPFCSWFPGQIKEGPVHWCDCGWCGHCGLPVAQPLCSWYGFLQPTCGVQQCGLLCPQARGASFFNSLCSSTPAWDGLSSLGSHRIHPFVRLDTGLFAWLQLKLQVIYVTINVRNACPPYPLFICTN